MSRGGGGEMRRLLGPGLEDSFRDCRISPGVRHLGNRRV